MLNNELLAIFFGCTARSVLDLVGNPKYRFSHDAAQIINFSYRAVDQIRRLATVLLDMT